MVKDCIIHSYSKSFLNKNSKYIDKWISSACESNSTTNLYNLITHTSDINYSPKNMCNVNIPTLLINGNEDEIIPTENAKELAKLGNFEYKEIIGSGHNVPIEKSNEWSNTVLDFIKK